MEVETIWTGSLTFLPTWSTPNKERESLRLKLPSVWPDVGLEQNFSWRSCVFSTRVWGPCPKSSWASESSLALCLGSAPPVFVALTPQSKLSVRSLCESLSWLGESVGRGSVDKKDLSLEGMGRLQKTKSRASEICLLQFNLMVALSLMTQDVCSLLSPSRLIQTHFIISPESNWTTTQEWRLYLGFWSHWMFVCFSFFWDLQLQGLSEFTGLLIFLFLKTLFLFIWLCWTLAMVHRIFSCSMWILPVGAWGIWFPDQGSNPDPLYLEHRILATGPPGKSLYYCLLTE